MQLEVSFIRNQKKNQKCAEIFFVKGYEWRMSTIIYVCICGPVQAMREKIIPTCSMKFITVVQHLHLRTHPLTRNIHIAFRHAEQRRVRE
jgi:hypothetical protein